MTVAPAQHHQYMVIRALVLLGAGLCCPVCPQLGPAAPALEHLPLIWFNGVSD